MQSELYAERYFQRRRAKVDASEWLDIELALKVAGVRKRVHRILDVGGGTGELARWLRGRGWLADYCDPHAPGAPPCSLPSDVPQADAYVLQHVLEHVEDPYGAVASLLDRRPLAVVAVLPGHFVEDETHVCNHFRPSALPAYRGLWGGSEDVLPRAAGRRGCLPRLPDRVDRGQNVAPQTLGSRLRVRRG
ncbi:hypothetical protein DKAM_0311 [Desulfurococcus amylolyticus 1221n]|uniref:Methyltransferase type 11 n=1 Tax=Desulfurococcus amylolyticus (strain DSM 18924 / JCM 16383 / VKM B-2413 / 1221n) TaxID=490899 RepID=B8D3F6_DESA1|nr:methyltransferase domain-containing protein [Desulfurococcus amylolyticus]ACL10637.1 hypothetical protein DKAM_0311 [Desulfurococcus amylolyticus 1221n]